MNTTLLQQLVQEKLVSVQKHPEAELYIYNYSPKVQYEKLWNEITLQTRGLILGNDFRIIARPFGKFFNFEELQPSEIPSLPFDVFEKLDGSLGILYFVNDTPFIATRGSFVSLQAIHATKILHQKYQHCFGLFNRNKTYLFEIIYPANRIVVDYGMLDDLILLTVIDNKTGEESIEDIGFKTVRRYDGIRDIAALQSLESQNKEGFVVRFQNNFRIKVKFAEYVRLHRIITGVSNITVWEYLKDGKPFTDLLDRVPDEFFEWLHQTKNTIESDFNDLHTNALETYLQLYHTDRKTFALRVMAQAEPISSILFNLYSNKPVAPVMWKMVRPEYNQSFKINTGDI